MKFEIPFNDTVKISDYKYELYISFSTYVNFDNVNKIIEAIKNNEFNSVEMYYKDSNKVVFKVTTYEIDISLEKNADINMLFPSVDITFLAQYLIKVLMCQMRLKDLIPVIIELAKKTTEENIKKFRKIHMI